MIHILHFFPSRVARDLELSSYSSVRLGTHHNLEHEIDSEHRSDTGIYLTPQTKYNEHHLTQRRILAGIEKTSEDI